MQSVYNYVVEPLGERYNNTKKVGDKELILNTEIFNHQHVNREAKVLSVPKIGGSEIQQGDVVTLHHNVFRRWHDVKGREKNSRSYWKEDKYFISTDQIFLYKQKEWKAMPGFSFIKPLKKIDKFNTEEERPLMGVIKYSDGTFNKNELIGFIPDSEYEFIIDNERLYRVLNKFTTIKYEYQGNEEEYNPSWTQSS